MIHQVVGEGVTGTLGMVGVVVTVETVTGEVAMVTASEEIGIVKVVIVTMSVQAREVITVAPTYLCESLRRRKSIHYHNSRNRESLDIPPSKTKSGQRRFLHRAVNIWNNLDKDFKQLSLTSFAKKS